MECKQRPLAGSSTFLPASSGSRIWDQRREPGYTVARSSDDAGIERTQPAADPDTRAVSSGDGRSAAARLAVSATLSIWLGVPVWLAGAAQLASGGVGAGVAALVVGTLLFFRGTSAMAQSRHARLMIADMVALAAHDQARPAVT